MILLIRYLRRAWRRRSAAGPEGPRPAASSRAAETTGATPAASGPLALLAHQARYDTLASMRNPRARFFTFVFPILLLIIFSSVFGNGKGTVIDGTQVSISRYFVGGIIALSVITAAYSGLAITITVAREAGVLKRRRATPVPPAILIGGQALSTLLTAAITAVLLLLVARIGYGIGFSAGALAAISVTVVAGTMTFACLGYAVAGFITSPDAAQPIVQFTTLPLYFFSGVWIPSASLSPALRHIAAVFPVEHLAAALHLATVRGSFSAALAPSDLLVLAAWAVATAVFATRRFSWLPVVASA
jgi:ABC-2 type transport system permease protein